MWASDDKVLCHLTQAVKNTDRFCLTRPFMYYATDTLYSRKGVKTK